MTDHPALSFAGVRFAYDPTSPTVVRDVTLDILDGAVTAVLGPNGAGKTTLLHLGLGLLSPTGGTIRLYGRSQADMTRREMSRLVAMVPQNEHVPFDFTVCEYVLMGRSPHISTLGMPTAADERAAEHNLRVLGLEELGSRPVPELSGGERQLVTLARALTQSTRVLLLDEPAAHLDLGNALRLRDILERLAGEGTTVVFSTHDPGAAAAVADHMVLMRDGRLICHGPTETVFTSARLSETYSVPIEVATVEGYPVVVPGTQP